MKYIDSGSRNPSDALGTWLGQIAQDANIVELRCQTGFFSVDSLGQIVGLISRLRDDGCLTRLLIGSNDGTTRRSDIEILLNIVGPSRQGLDVGIVSFANSYFHPKTIHLKRRDGSMMAYVGSANLTKSGVSALHVEAGITLDTKDGDDLGLLSHIADAVDWWFESPHRPGMFRISSPTDLDSLVTRNVLGYPPTYRSRPAAANSGVTSVLPNLSPLVSIPPIAVLGETRITQGAVPESMEDDEPIPGRIFVEEEWSKPLTISDAQRKSQGNQRGSITLTKKRYSINAQTYFRQVFYGGVHWTKGRSRTGRLVESAEVPMLVTIRSVNLGSQNIRLTHAPARESGQGNYTTLIHLGPLEPYFRAANMFERQMTISRRNDGTFSLDIE